MLIDDNRSKITYQFFTTSSKILHICMCFQNRKEWKLHLERRKMLKEKEKQIFSDMFTRGRVYQDSTDDTRVQHYANKHFASNNSRKLSCAKDQYDDNSLDFRNPSKVMIKVAKDMNINLKDTAVINFLEKMQNEERKKNLPIRRCHPDIKYSSSDSHILDKFNFGIIQTIQRYSNVKTYKFIIATFSIYLFIRLFHYLRGNHLTNSSIYGTIIH